jgi:hypothetical protein
LSTISHEPPDDEPPKSPKIAHGREGSRAHFTHERVRQFGIRCKARRWYDAAAQWMDKNQPNHPTLGSIRAEAKALLNEE